MIYSRHATHRNIEKTKQIHDFLIHVTDIVLLNVN